MSLQTLIDLVKNSSLLMLSNSL